MDIKEGDILPDRSRYCHLNVKVKIQHWHRKSTAGTTDKYEENGSTEYEKDAYRHIVRLGMILTNIGHERTRKRSNFNRMNDLSGFARHASGDGVC